MAVSNSSNMNLPIPGVGTEAGPDYAFDVNSSLTLIDQHDHSTGKGVQIKTAGLDIDQNLNFNSHSGFNLSALTLETQTSAPAIQSLYVKAAGTSPVINELWYIDSASQEVQITANGIVNVVASSITGLSYASGVFTFTQAQDALPTTPASLSAGNVTLKPIAAATPYGVTLKPPSAIASLYDIKMPLLPVAQSFMTIDASGNEAAPIAFSQGITTANIAPLTILGSNIANQTITPAKAAVSSSVVATTYTVSATDLAVFYDASAGSFNTTLPTPVGIGGRVIKLKKIDTTLNSITILTAAGSIVDPGPISPIMITVGEEWEFTSDGTNWQVTSHKSQTPPVAYVPNVPGWTTLNSSSVFSWREGKYLVIEGNLNLSGPTNASALITIGVNGINAPPGITIDYTVIAGGGTDSPIGEWGSLNTNYVRGMMITQTPSANSFGFGIPVINSAGGINVAASLSIAPASVGNFGGNGTKIALGRCYIPITQWNY